MQKPHDRFKPLKPESHKLSDMPSPDLPGAPPLKDCQALDAKIMLGLGIPGSEDPTGRASLDLWFTISALTLGHPRSKLQGRAMLGKGNYGGCRLALQELLELEFR